MVYIKFFGLLIVALYVYVKILNITHISKIKIVSAILFSIIMSVPLSHVPLYELVFLGSFCLFASITTRVKLPLLVTAVIISTGISLGIEILAYTIVLLLSFFLCYLSIFAKTMFNISLLDITQALPMIVQITSFIISVIIARFFFSLKRLKKGFVFLESKEAKWVGLTFSIIIMLTRSFIEETFFVLAAINFCTIGIHFWWQYHTTILYKQRLKEHDIERYLTEIEEKDKQVKELVESNNFLSKTVHRDNKLIPAMYNAVNNFLNETNENIDFNIKIKGLNILTELNNIMQERKEMISQIQRECKPLPSTGMERIDCILSHMFLKAVENEIQFDFVVSGSIMDVAESVISMQKLETLLADLIENAIIAVSYSSYKKILITMAVIDNYYEISIQDSGIPFEIEILVNLGIIKSTTHSDRGGSGIGYLTIFEILGEVGASIIISEQPPENNSFSKSVKIRFDKKFEYIIYSYRAELIKLSSERKGMFIYSYECNISGGNVS